MISKFGTEAAVRAEQNLEPYDELEPDPKPTSPTHLRRRQPSAFDPTTAAQPSRREPLLMPQSGLRPARRSAVLAHLRALGARHPETRPYARPTAGHDDAACSARGHGPAILVGHSCILSPWPRSPRERRLKLLEAAQTASFLGVSQDEVLRRASGEAPAGSQPMRANHPIGYG